VGAARGRALLTLILEGAPRHRYSELLRVGRRVSNEEVLAASLANQTRVTLVVADIGADACPHRVEDRGAAGEMHAGQIRRVEQNRRDLRGVTGYVIDDTRRQTRRFEQPEDVMRAEHRAGR